VELAVRAAELEPGAGEEDALRNSLLADTQLAVLRAQSPVRFAEFDPSGRRIAIGAKDGKVRVYRVGADSVVPEHVLNQGGTVTALAYADGFLLTAGHDGTARLWSRATGALLRTLDTGSPVRTAFFGEGSQLVVTLADDGLIRVWRTSDGSKLLTIQAERPAIPQGAAVDPGGNVLVTFGADRYARMYSLHSGLLIRRLQQKGRIHCAVFSPDGARLMTCGHEGIARVWSGTTGRPLQRLRGPQFGSAIVDGVFSPRGRLVAAAVSDGTARVWEPVTGQQIGVMFGHSNPTTSVAFNRPGTAIVTGSLDERARTWLTNGKPVAILAGHAGAINSVAFSPNGRSVLTSSEDGTARLWASGTAPNLRVFAHQASLTAFALSPDGRRVIVGDSRGVARVRNVGRHYVLSSIRVHGPVTAVAFGPEGPIVATRPIRSLAVSLASSSVARGRSDGLVTIVRRGHPKQILQRQGAGVTAVGFSHDGRLLATGDGKGTIRVWNLAAGRVLRVFSGDTAAITSVAFSPDGSLLLTASEDHEARTWDVRGGPQPRHRIRWHFGPLGGAAFSPDGRWILTAGPSTAGVGPVSTARRLLLLRGHTRPLIGAAFGGPDGRTIVTASKDGTIRAYRCNICGGISELLRLAKHRLRSR
jgi:WD40 repeat protein